MFLLRLSALFPLFLLPPSAVKAGDVKPLYQFTFDNGSLSSSGSLSADAQEINTMLEVKKDDGLGLFAATFPLIPEGTRGALLVIQDSEQQLNLTQPEDAMTISAWLKWSGPSKNPDTAQAIAVSSTWSFSVTKEGKLRFYWLRNGSAIGRDSNDAIPIDEWTHIVMTWENSRESGLHFYINGADAGVNQGWAGVGPLGPITAERPISIAASDTKYGYLPLNGSLADLRLYPALVGDISQLAQKPSK